LLPSVQASPKAYGGLNERSFLKAVFGLLGIFGVALLVERPDTHEVFIG
jgi:hypothetical protein